MKLLTWMHRKFKQGSTETMKDYPLGQAFLDDHQVYHKQNHMNGSLRQGHRDGSQARKSFACLESTRREDLEYKTSTEFSQLFEGFLAIGTLGTETVVSEPDTPTFAVSFEKLAEGETEVTETELRLINDELERVLASEAKEDGWTDSSSRNSHVSNGRISHASSITLSGKPLEISETQTLISCPLQEYLLGSAVEFPDNKTPVLLKKEQRMSLGELFERHKAEEISENKYYKKGDKKDDNFFNIINNNNKDGDKNSMNLMKKILKKKIASASFKSSSTVARGNSDPVNSADTKLCKILHKFHKKVHPEYTSTEKTHKIGIKDVIPCNAGHNKEYQPLSDDHEINITAISQRSIKNGFIHHNKSRSIIVGGANDPNKNKECWIKTDADYLVLEL